MFLQKSSFCKTTICGKRGFKNILIGFDRELRNCIAHMRYDIKEKGTIEYIKTQLTQQDQRDKSRILFEMVARTFMALANQYVSILKSIEENSTSQQEQHKSFPAQL